MVEQKVCAPWSVFAVVGQTLAMKAQGGTLEVMRPVSRNVPLARVAARSLITASLGCQRPLSDPVASGWAAKRRAVASER